MATIKKFFASCSARRVNKHQRRLHIVEAQIEGVYMRLSSGRTKPGDQTLMEQLLDEHEALTASQPPHNELQLIHSQIQQQSGKQRRRQRGRAIAAVFGAACLVIANG